MKKRIICFGDSNTWGYNPTNGTRYDENTRWPMVLQKLLGDDYRIIEEGQNGRTIALEDPWEWGDKCGIDYVVPMVESHNPFDLLIIMLGTNDLKIRFNLPAGDVAGSLQNMLMKIKSFLEYNCRSKAKILVVAPPHLSKALLKSPFAVFLEKKVQYRDLRNWHYGMNRLLSSLNANFLTHPRLVPPVMQTEFILWKTDIKLLPKLCII